MADKENSSDMEMIQNLEPSEQKESNGGKMPVLLVSLRLSWPIENLSRKFRLQFGQI